MVKDYLNRLKAKGNFSFSYLAKASDVTEATVRKIFSGDTEDPRIDTVIKLDAAMGGQLANIISGKVAYDFEANAVITIKETYEARLADQREHISTVKKTNRVLTIAVIALGVALVGALIFDIIIGTHGWIQY